MAPEAPTPATSFLAAPMTLTKAGRAPAPLPQRRVVVEPPSIPVHVAPAAAAAMTALPPKADCDPPFYFEGTKKIFKPSCI